MRSNQLILRTITLLLLGGGVFAVDSCGFLHDEQVVAKVGSKKLYRSQLAEFVPKGLNPDDSARIAQAYITNWASDILYLEMAEKQLSKTDRDVTEELADYRRSILKYRYEQRYVDNRLITFVSEDQVDEYYASHKDMFRLERPILKVRFVSLMKDAPHSESILKLLSSEEPDELSRLDTLAYHSSLKYFDASQKWMDAEVLAAEFGMSWREMMACRDGDRMRINDGATLREAYIADIVESGYAPIEYCEEEIKDLILNARKRQLLYTLEQDLLNTARENNEFVIY